MAFIQCECGERIDLNQPVAQVTCHECGRTYTVPKLAGEMTPDATGPAPAAAQHATPLSSTMVEDLPVMTQFENQFGDSIVAMAQQAVPAAGFAGIAPPTTGNSTDSPNLIATPAGKLTPASQSHVDTHPNSGFATELAPGLRLLDRYEIQRKIGQGGMSTVYEAFDAVRGEKVALKVLLPNLAAQPVLQERFLQEGRLSSNFSHPNIARVYDLHQTESLIFLSMELLHGTTLRHDMNRRKDQRQVYRPMEVLALLDHICDALEVVHGEGVVHRDLKPENLWLALDGTTKVMDFGIARDATGVSYTNGGQGSGTPYYIAPEQLASSPTMDDRADQYSVAIIMYELLTGELPQGAIVAPHEKNPEIPRKMSEAIFRALDSDPTNRFDTIAAFREAAQFRTEQSWVAKALKTVATLALIVGAGYAFVRWGAPLFEKEESPVWEALGPQQVVEGQELRFAARSALCTIESDALKFKLLSDAPVGASLDASTGEFVWTPTEAQGPQNYNFTIMAVAEEQGRAPVVHERVFTVQVDEQVDNPLFATPDPISGEEHEELVYQIEASDPNLPAVGLRYDLPELLPGMTIDHRAGTIKWTPNEQQGGKNYQLAVRVYLDGDAHEAHFTERTLNVQVAESIDPPVINAPETFTGIVDEPSNIRVIVRDPNVPEIDDYLALKNADRIGMTIDPQTGEIFWTPTGEQAGTEQEITIQTLRDERGKTSVLSERVVRVIVSDVPNETAESDGSQTPALPGHVGTPLVGGGALGGGIGGGSIGHGGVGGVGGGGGNCKAPRPALPSTGQSSAPVFGGQFPSTIGSNRPAGGGGQRPSGGGNSGGRGNNNLRQMIELVEQIKKKKQQAGSNSQNGTSHDRDKPSSKPSNKLPTWLNKPPTTGIRLQDLQKKGQAKQNQSSLKKYTRDLPISGASSKSSSNRTWNKTSLPSPTSSRTQKRTSNKVQTYGLPSWQQKSRQATASTRASGSRVQQQNRSNATNRSTSNRGTGNRSKSNNKSGQSRGASQWEQLKNASKSWGKR